MDERLTPSIIGRRAVGEPRARPRTPGLSAAAEYRRRLQQLGYAGALVSLVSWAVAHAVADVGGQSVGIPLAGDIVWLSLFAVLIVSARSRRVTIRQIEVLEGATTVLLGACWALAEWMGSPDSGIEVGMVFLTMWTIFGRAVVVPSSLVRSLVVGGCTIAPLTAVMWLRQGRFLADQTPNHVFMVMMMSTIGLGLSTFISAAVSQLIYRLSREADDAARLGQYTLEHTLGEGNNGTVYLGRHQLLRRAVAIKVLKRSRIESRAAFEREVTLTSALTHPNTVSVLDYGWTDDGTFYYVMEYLDGLDLERLVRQHGPLPAWRVIHLLRQAAGSLSEAHALGLIHRDVKPANLIVSRRGGIPDVLHVLDFGLASHSQKGSAMPSSLVGTAGYLAPEVLRDPASVDARADIYALGAVGYFLLTGNQVFDGASFTELCLRHAGAEPESPSLRAPWPVPEGLDALILRCLAKEPADRPADAGALAEALDDLARQAAPFDRGAAHSFWVSRERASRSAAAMGSISRSPPPPSKEPPTQAPAPPTDVRPSGLHSLHLWR